jgi:hypothetical protein
MADDRAEQEAFTWQISRLAALEAVLEDYLHEAPTFLAAALPRARPAEQRDILLALYDLRADGAKTILPLLATPTWGHAELAVLTLTWSREPQVGPFLRSWATRRIPLTRRTRSQPRASAPRRSSVPDDVPYRAILRALRGHASPETESLLLLASIDWDPTYRAAAISSLGWWEPFRRNRVLPCLQNARRDPNPEVREMARAALGRLGERQALQSFRQRLLAEDTQRIHETLQLVAGEAVMLLWPDLDRLADAEDADVAYHAREALERLREELNVRPA